jgi:hypothetical protein
MDQTHNGKIAKPEMAAMSGAMSKADREALVKLVRRAERAHKTLAEQRKAEQLADFERQLATIHKYYDDEVWQEAYAEASRVVAEADAKIAERCRELGIPEDWRPGLSVGWYERGENAMKQRRGELRKVAQTRIDADYKRACTAIEMHSVELQSQLVAGGLESDAARAFLKAMPSPEVLMPLLDAAEIDKQLPLRKPDF